MFVSKRRRKCSDFKGKYSRRRHLRVLLPLSFYRHPRSIPKHPEMSKPSSPLKFSRTPLRLSPVRRLRKRRLKFLISFISEQRANTTLSSICLQYERSSLIKPLSIERLTVRVSFERYCPFLIQKSCIVCCDFWHILRSEVFEMKLYLELMA
jgi:hypothetical protein